LCSLIALTLIVIVVSFKGNNQLVDIAYVLDIQQLAPTGTLVANNSQLCFDAALSWSHRSDSHLEYHVGQVCCC
jgi:hypothetical protein